MSLINDSSSLKSKSHFFKVIGCSRVSSISVLRKIALAEKVELP